MGKLNPGVSFVESVTYMTDAEKANEAIREHERDLEIKSRRGYEREREAQFRRYGRNFGIYEKDTDNRWFWIN